MDTTILSKIQSSTDLDNIHNLFSEYLRPFTPYLDSKKVSSSKSAKTLDTTAIRSLAKQFLPFLNKCLSILPKRLSSDAESAKLPQDFARELFEVYRLCIGCLEVISSQLSCKPYSIEVQWTRFIHALEAWKLYEEAEMEGLLVLERIRGSGNVGAKSGKLKNRLLLPRLSKENSDRELALLVVEMVVTLVKCVYMNQSKEVVPYKRILTLVEEAAPWFKILEASESDKLHRMLVAYLDRISLFLFGQSVTFGLDLVHKFCDATFCEYQKSSSEDQMCKFASRICSSILSLEDIQFSSTTHILRLALTCVADGCKGKDRDDLSAVKFLELVYSCTNKCYAATPAVSRAVAAELSSLAGFQARPVVGSIRLLFAVGLVMLSFSAQQRNAEIRANTHSDNMSGSLFFLDKEDALQKVPSALRFLKNFFNKDGGGNDLAEKGTKFMPLYYKALKFLCHQLAEHIYEEKRAILGERDGESFSHNLSIAQDALHQFCYLIIECHSAAVQNNGLANLVSEDIKTVARSAVAAFTISIRMGRYVKESVTLVKHLISDGWLQATGVKSIFAWLYNVALLLYKDKKVKEASKALRLSCKACWSCLVNHCNPKEPGGNLSTDASKDFMKEALYLFTEACEKTIFLLDIFYEVGREKINKIMLESLKEWSIAESMLKMLPPPFSLVKHWVKLEYKGVKDVKTEVNGTTLYSLLSSSKAVSQRAIGILLEQELLVYKTTLSVNPGYCQKMRIIIIDTLLERVYVSNDTLVYKARTLIAKGGECRGLGVEKLDECIHYLSEAISTLSDVYLESSLVIEAHHMMAYAFCLRALCYHESIRSNSKVLLLESDFEDIRSAVNLWMSPPQQISDAHSKLTVDILLSSMLGTDRVTELVDDMLRLLFHVLDLLSTKGYMEIHSDIYELLIRLFKWKKLSLEEALAILWQNKRLGHGPCASPINEMFISKLSLHYGELAESFTFWVNCMNLSKSLRVDFQQSLLSMLTASVEGSHSGGTSLSDTVKDNDMLAPSDFACHVSIDEVTLAAGDLNTCVADSNISVFHSAYLYYDLSDKLLLNGQLIKALSYAKEAHRFRTKLFQDKFVYSVDQHTENSGESVNGVQSHGYGLGIFHTRDRVAMEAWGFDVESDFKGSILTPWNVLQCYLESTLQVGMIHEMLGNCSQSQSLFSWGKTIALRQSLPIYVISFSLALGKLYEKQWAWESAQTELEAASQILAENCSMISCVKCRMLLEVSIYQQLGDLFKSRYCSCPGNMAETLSCAGKMYLSASEKLNLCHGKDQNLGFGKDRAEQAVYEVRSKMFDCKVDYFPMGAIHSETGKQEAKDNQRKLRKTKKNQTSSSSNGVFTSRTTRSMSRSSKTDCQTTAIVKSRNVVNSNDDQPVAKISAPKQEDPSSNSSLANSLLEIRRICSSMICWHCLGLQVCKSSSLIGLLRMKWELIRKRRLLLLLNSIGECLAIVDDIHKTHETVLLSISVFTNPFCPCFTSVPCASWMDFFEKDSMQDVLAIERAMLLYNICRIALRDYSHNVTREAGCQLSCVGIPRIFSWLKLSFRLCAEVPLLLQKVSRLLAVLYVLSTSIKAFALSDVQTLSESHWVSFFHQASIGAQMNQQLTRELKSRTADFMVFGTSGPNIVASEGCNSNRASCELVNDLDKVASIFFDNLPCSTIISVSILGGSDATLLTELLGCSSARAWILLSRMRSSSRPVCLLLPVDSILEECSVAVGTFSGMSNEPRNFVKPWKCPWASSVVDNVAPIFKAILKENYLSSSIYPPEDTEKNRFLWWSERKRLDNCLAKFLENLEDQWLGPWKYLLVGECTDNELLCALERELVADLKLKYKVDVDMNLLRVLIGAIQFAPEIREHGLQLILNKGCYIGGWCKEIINSSAECKIMSVDLFNEVIETDPGLEIESFARKPVMLVLDVEIQMLPWESLPILRNEEVYRMPSVASICALLDKGCHNEEVLGEHGEAFSLIDPLDSFYLLNPSGDLIRTQEEFEDWFKNQNFGGTSGSWPPIEELLVALTSHDLFIYFGHGSGSQYISGHEIQKLKTCAAALLMGCSSGSLSLNGCYAPEGAPLCYLSAGSSVVVANLWEVTDKDIDRFGKALLESWLRQRSVILEDCPECSLLVDKFRSLDFSDTTKNGKGKKRGKNKSRNASDHEVSVQCCNHRPNIGAFMGQARKACQLPSLIGAAPVCYGVPTGLTSRQFSSYLQSQIYTYNGKSSSMGKQ